MQEPTVTSADEGTEMTLLDYDDSAMASPIRERARSHGRFKHNVVIRAPIKPMSSAGSSRIQMEDGG